MDVGKAISDSIGLAAALISDIEAVVKQGGGLMAEGVNLIEVVIADEKVRASLSALIADIKG